MRKEDKRREKEMASLIVGGRQRVKKVERGYEIIERHHRESRHYTQ